MPASRPLPPDPRNTPSGVFALPSLPVPAVVTCRPPLTVRLASTRPAPAVLWVRPDPPAVVVSELLAAHGDEATDGFELMAVGGAGRLTLVRAVRPPAAVTWSGGYVGSAVPGLYLPVGRRLVPATSHDLTPPAGYLSWLCVGGELVLHTARADFRPLAEWWAVSVPPTRHLEPTPAASPFDHHEPQLVHTVRASSVIPPRALAHSVTARVEPQRRPRSRLVRAVSVLASPAARPEAVPTNLQVLEGRLIAATANDPVTRAEQWAGLAAAYRAAGRRADEAVCWLNAAWCHPTPPLVWPQPWSVGEAREASLPVRAVWLGQLARFDDDGDTLAVARCRDRLLARLAGGLELDRDVPSFLRRDDRRIDPDAVRTWLDNASEPVRHWLAGCHTATKLTWAGLDGDRAATQSYGELILAWGAATVGHRTALDRAGEAITTLLALKRPAGTDPAVHKHLGERFIARIRAALSGQPEPTPAATVSLGVTSRYAVDRLCGGCESVGRSGVSPLATASGELIAAAENARAAHRPTAFRELLDSLDPAVALETSGPLFRAARGLGLIEDAARLLATLSTQRPTPGGRRDLGLAVGRYLVGDQAGGDRTLDAARKRLFVDGVPDLRKRGELAIAYAIAVGHAAPGLILGRLDELFRRLGPVSAQGACGRYFALLPLRVVDAAVRAAVGDDFAPSDAVRRWLADEEWQTRRRIHADVRKVLGDDLT